METFNFSTENFLEPSQKYINEWYDKPYIKEMYNWDLINFVKQYKSKIGKKVALPNFINDYKSYQELYDLPNIEDIVDLFSDYPLVDVKKLDMFIIQKNFKL
jgi:hypothetical protein